MNVTHINCTLTICKSLAAIYIVSVKILTKYSKENACNFSLFWLMKVLLKLNTINHYSSSQNVSIKQCHCKPYFTYQWCTQKDFNTSILIWLPTFWCPKKEIFFFTMIKYLKWFLWKSFFFSFCSATGYVSSF